MWHLKVSGLLLLSNHMLLTASRPHRLLIHMRKLSSLFLECWWFYLLRVVWSLSLPVIMLASQPLGTLGQQQIWLHLHYPYPPMECKGTNKFLSSIMRNVFQLEMLLLYWHFLTGNKDCAAACNAFQSLLIFVLFKLLVTAGFHFIWTGL